MTGRVFMNLMSAKVEFSSNTAEFSKKLNVAAEHFLFTFQSNFAHFLVKELPKKS